MSSPAPDDLRIRLTIELPRRASARSVRSLERYTLPEPAPSARCAVLPDGSGLGTHCARVTYPTSELLVWAAAYPELQFPEDPPPTFPLAAWARPGTPSANRTVWTWDASYPVLGAAHTDTETGAPNMLAFWYQTGPLATVYDAAHLFYGVTNSMPCSGFGGSGSGSGSMLPINELAAGVLLVVVPDGPHAGQHLAPRVGAMAWRTTVGGVVYTIDSADGRTLTVRAGAKAAVSKTTGFNPFSATFCGNLFAARNDIVVITP